MSGELSLDFPCLFAANAYDAGIDGGGVDGHAAPAADTDDAAALRVNILLHGEEVYRRAEILSVDIRQCASSIKMRSASGSSRVAGRVAEAFRNGLKLKK